MKRKDFAKYGEREGVVLAVQHDGGIVWQDMTVDMCSKSGRPITNHPIVLSEKDLKRPKKREYNYTALSVSVGRVTERAIGCTIAGIRHRCKTCTDVGGHSETERLCEVWGKGRSCTGGAT